DTPDDSPLLILSEDFESGMPSDWDLIDADGDGNNWYLDTYTGHNSNNCVSSESYDYNNSEALSPDNYLISPLLNNASKMEYWVFAVDNTPYEHYAVMASTTGNSISDFTNVFEETMTNPNHWYKRSINLPPETKYIAFRHYNCTNQKGLKIDDISIYGNIIPTTAPHTYTITRNGEEIASGLTEKTYTDLDLDFNTYNYCVKAVYGYCTSETACTNVIIEDSLCLPISDLSVIINGNDVNLTWEDPSAEETYTYTITRNEVEIANGLTETTYTDLDLDFGTYNYCVKAVSEDCTPQAICESIILEDQSICLPVNNLNATVNENNTVSLNWLIPQQTDWPSNCSEDIAFRIYKGTTQIGYSDANDLTSWTTNVLSNGTYELKVVILYYDNNSNLLCTAEANTTVNITNSFVCLPVNNLSAVVNNNNTVSLNWTIPEELPISCDGNIAFKFYNGNINIGSSNNDNLTSWTTPELSIGTHFLTVSIYYLDNTNAEICYAETSITVTIESSFDCQAVNNLSATVNSDNTVDLTWDIPAETEWPNACAGNLAFHFYNGSTKLGESDEDNLTLWTTGILPNGTHTLKVVIYYYDNNTNLICSAEASITVIVSGSFACPSLNELSAIVNENNTVNLSWTLPTDLPTNCNGNLDFKFYDGTTQIGYDISDDLTSWTTPVLSAGTHTLAVVVYYYDDEDIEICYAEASVTVTTDIEEIKVSLFSAEIFPNPAKDLLNIKCDSEIISYELYDALGRLLINKKEVANTESIVNVSSLKHGMYMLRLNTEKGSGTFKLIIDN
ncbi:MAG TPA: T9SS type A sorting domain-containing protein, partial [Bacteroidales bacterium]|nr:T9SS type A sorting domain-containing protein [Bacteroidales bacterium]